MKKGFTLIELLVVVAIIGVLSSIVIGGINGIREEARDVKRRNDISTIQEALEIYHIDHNRYPTSVGMNTPGENDWAWAKSSGDSWNNLSTELGIDLPKDPINESNGINGYAYSYFSYHDPYGLCPAGSYYILTYRTETGSASEENSGIELCNGAVLDYANRNLITVGLSPEEAILNN